MTTREHLREIASQAPLSPGVYLYKDPSGQIIYVGKANNLRARVRSYFSDDRLAEPKTGALIAAAAAIDFIVVANPKEALALENELIKRHKPRFNILLRDDKTYPYIKLTAETFPRVYVTRRLLKDGATYFGPYFPGNLAHRLVHFIHRYFKIPSCHVDLTRSHSHPCLEYHIHRCLGPCAGLTTIENYAAAAQNVRYFLEGRLKDLSAELRSRMEAASADLRFEEAASLRDLLATIEEREEKQRIAAAEGADVDIYAYYAEPPLVAINLFHLRNGRIVERRDFFWEDQPDFSPAEFFASLLKQVYLSQPYVPALIHVPVDFEERAELEEFLSDKRGRKCEIHTPRRGEKKAMLALAETNARQSFEQRFRVMRPNSKAIQEALRDTLGLEDPPRRIECFDISHFQGDETVASMVVWEDGRMKKSDYRKFLIKTVEGIDDFASMREVVTRRYSRLQQENKPLPGLILIDGGIGQLHAAADALDSLGILNQPLASIAKREEIIYVYGNEDEPIQLDRFSPVLHLIQTVRDEAHRFAITFHRGRRASARMTSELASIPGVGPKTIAKLLREFGSPDHVRAASEASLARAAGPAAAKRLRAFFEQTSPVQPESYTEK